jgi:uncharacterized membrane protein YqjE
MIKHIFRLISQRPDLILDYVSAYAALIQDELAQSKRRRIRRLICAALALILSGAFVVVASVAAMLMMSIDNISLIHLWSVPGLLLLVTLITALVAIYDTPKTGMFEAINEQLHEDRQLLETAWRINDDKL